LHYIRTFQRDFNPAFAKCAQLLWLLVLQALSSRSPLASLSSSLQLTEVSLLALYAQALLFSHQVLTR
jgi:hypothetical protein